MWTRIRARIWGGKNKRKLGFAKKGGENRTGEVGEVGESVLPSSEFLEEAATHWGCYPWLLLGLGAWGVGSDRSMFCLADTPVRGRGRFSWHTFQLAHFWSSIPHLVFIHLQPLPNFHFHTSIGLEVCWAAASFAFSSTHPSLTRI